jgi:phosphatidate cytidylyltransferase
MFAKRLVSSIMLWTILLLVLFYTDSLCAALFCCLISAFALLEFYDMLNHGGLRCSKMIGITGGVLLSLGPWIYQAAVLVKSGSWPTQPYHPPSLALTNAFEILAIAGLVIALILRQILNHANPDPLQTVGNTLLGVVYISWLFCFIPKIRTLQFDVIPGQPIDFGILFVFYLVAVTKFCDIGAYLTGRFFGRTKLIPRISPNKTWEGLVGGIVIAIVASLTVFKYLEPRIRLVNFDYSDAIIVGVALGILGTLGDLGESLFKRESQVKDSGGMLPGIGGSLDLIDSLLFTSPVFYAYLVLFIK